MWKETGMQREKLSCDAVPRKFTLTLCRAVSLGELCRVQFLEVAEVEQKFLNIT
jgi:hypothetical protein